MGWNGQAVRRARAWLALQLPLPCPYCGAPVELGTSWDVDHATPRAYGGTDSAGNLRAAHAACNRSAGADTRRDRTRQLRRWPA